MSNVQEIGIDIGRGYLKGYTEYNGITKQCLIKAIIGDGRSIDFSNYEEPVYMNYNGKNLFVGLLAEKESNVPVRNSKESKTSATAQTLVAAAINKLAVADNIKIMFGVPKDSFRKSILAEVTETYKDKEIKVKDLIQGGTKIVKIVDVGICREADAAAYWELRNKTDITKPVGFVVVGFRTTETAYFDAGLKFNDKKSSSIEFGNKSAMNLVRERLITDRDTKKEINEIDSSDEYNDLKSEAYDLVKENIEQYIEDAWINLDEMDVYIGGGTSLKMNFDDKYKKVEDAQLAVAKGLWLVGTRRFK